MQTRFLPAIKAAIVLAMAGALAGCSGGGSSATKSFASNSFASTGSGPTVAFESIDGPPPQVFERMVSLIDAESKTRNLSIVSREGAASYRVRSYLSAQVSRGRTVIAWVWDVYDREGQRALRLAGEESAGSPGRDAARNAWSAADDAVLRRIAQAGLTGLNGIANGSAPVDVQPSPQPTPAILRGNGPAIASADGVQNTAALGFDARE